MNTLLSADLKKELDQLSSTWRIHEIVEGWYRRVLALEAGAPAAGDPNAEMLKALKHLVRWHDQLSKEDIAMAQGVIASVEGR